MSRPHPRNCRYPNDNVAALYFLSCVLASNGYPVMEFPGEIANIERGLNNDDRMHTIGP
jgi:hypothetical protein